MKLIYPLQKDMFYWKKKMLPTILLNGREVSPYSLVAIAESGFDIYVVFTNETKDEIWIEKTHKLLGIAGMYAKSFQKIESDEEFNKVHRFFIQQGILDGLKDT